MGHDQVLGAAPEVAAAHHRKGDTESADDERDTQKLARAMSIERVLAHVCLLVQVDAASNECTGRKENEGRQSHDQSVSCMGCREVRVAGVGIIAGRRRGGAMAIHSHGRRRRC